MPYSYLTFAQARAEAAKRLEDTGNIHFADAELGIYLLEAMREWQSWSGYWRDRGTFRLSSNTAFYDLTALLTDGAGQLMLAPTVTDTQMVTEILYHLLEPPAIPYAGTTQFTLDGITQALQRRRDQFLVETGAVVTELLLNVPSAPIGRVPLPDNVIDVRRAAWNTALASLGSYPVWLSDEFAANAFSPRWNLSPGTVQTYSILGPPPLTIQLLPPPTASGALDILMVGSGAALNPTAGVPLGIPDNLSWVVKWGALADLLSQDGEARDDFRAGYCEARWQEGIELARLMPVILLAALEEQPVFPQSVAELDAFRSSWCVTAGPPDSLATAGLNLLAAANIPDGGSYSVRLDVVRNAVTPVNDGDYIQVGREFLDVLLDESVHLAKFKDGGSDLENSVPMHQRFIRAAGIVSDRLRASTLYLRACGEQSSREKSLRPRRESDAEVAV